ncbi:MAG: guanine deaminase [Pseudomonadota bacterium]|nr:guanine deaminase [Pseudomonadota bacterium]
MSMKSDIGDALALKGRVLTFNDGPNSYDYWETGCVFIEGGFIRSVGSFKSVNVPENVRIIDYGEDLILAGFIDGHVHYPQMNVIASYGTKLIDWLNVYTFPEEAKFSDKTYAKAVAQFFISESLKNGYTTSAVFCTMHPQSVDVFFAEAERKNLRMVGGKVLMDRHAPDNLCDTAQLAYDQSLDLINKWHKNGRALYAVTPRFAPTSTPEQLEVASTLYKENEGVYIQSHVSENVDEISWVAELFPKASSYLDVYGRFNLLGPRTLYGHGIHFSDSDIEMVKDTDTSIVHCPTSNLFLGSGLFEYEKFRNNGVRVALGTDVGGGTSLSPFATMKGAYEIAQFRNFSLSPFEAFYMLTLGGAKALHLEDKIGRIQSGYEADLVVINLNSTELIRRRMMQVSDLDETLFLQIILADDRAIRATYVNGKKTA